MSAPLVSALPPLERSVSLPRLLAWLAIVAVAGSLVDFAGLNPLVGGAVLLFGCLILLIESVCRAARVSAS